MKTFRRLGVSYDESPNSIHPHPNPRFKVTHSYFLASYDNMETVKNQKSYSFITQPGFYGDLVKK